MNKINCLISGGNGFIGTNLCPKLEKLGFNVTVYDIKSNPLDDIRDKYRLETKFITGNFDIVIHMAARTGTLTSDEFPDEYISTNVSGTNNILALSKKYGVKKFIFFSSSSIFGGTKDGELIAEGYKIKPRTLYGVTKAAGELMVKASGLNYVIIRPFTVYGKNGRRDMVIYKWIDRIKSEKPLLIFGNGKTSRGYTYIEEFTDAVCRLVVLSIGAKFEKELSVTVNLGGAENVTLERMLLVFKEYCANNDLYFDFKNMELKSTDIEHSLADVSFAKLLVGFNPEKKKFKERLLGIIDSELGNKKIMNKIYDDEQKI